MFMNRVSLINLLIKKCNGENYLEIGIRNGKTINQILAKNKVGVDPEFELNTKLKWKRRIGSLGFKIYKEESDSFFDRHVSNAFKNGIDLVFVDGLHNYEQSLRDVENSLKFLNKDGFIVMHDCNPSSEAHGFPIKSSFKEIEDELKKDGIDGWTGEWNGDVWKTIVHLRSTRSDLSVFTLDSDFGLGIVRKGNNPNLLNVDIKSLLNKPYSYLEADRVNLLNLVSVDSLHRFL